MKKVVFILFAFAMSVQAIAQMNIQDARTNYDIDDTVTVTGIVTNDESLGSVRYIQDLTAGIAIYPGNSWDGFTEPQIGDEITVTGVISEFSGLLEVGPDLTSVTINSSGNPLPTPEIITPDEMNEGLEGQLCVINGALFNQGGQVIQGNSTYDFMASGESGTAYFRTSNALVGSVLTPCDANITGIVSQFSFDGFGGYQLLLRDEDDFETLSNICIASTVEQENLTTTSFDVIWSTDNPGDSKVEYGTTPALGQEVTDGTLTTDHVMSLTDLEPGTIYYVQVTSGADGEESTSPMVTFATVSESSGSMITYFTGSVNNSVATEELAISVGADMNDTIAAYILRAENTVDMAIYNINNSVLVDAINTAQSNGVQIRYIAQGTNANIGIGDFNAGIPLQYREDDNGSGMHNKFCIIDAESTENAVVITGSTNWTTGNLTTDYNNAIFIQDESLAKAYTIEFNEMWGSDGPTPDDANSRFSSDKLINTPRKFIIGGSNVELYFSPTDGTTAAIQAALQGIDYDHYFCLLSFTRDELAETQIAENSIFVDMAGIIEQTSDQASEFSTLQLANVPVYTHQGVPNDLHHKYAIIDQSEPLADPIVITGSHNWSSSAENFNDENTLIIHDAAIANVFYQEFTARLAEVNPDNIQELPNGLKVTLYPNPSTGIFSLQASNGTYGNMTVEVLDLTGKVVLKDNMTSVVKTLNLAHLSNGLYLVNLTIDGQSSSIKLQISK
ncbi:MAG: phospholipase D-like domain-containing protein [Flavobacteriales bacterium]